MNRLSCTNNSPSVDKLGACIKQAGVDQSIAHCLDGTIHWFQSHYSLYLRAAIKLAIYIFSRLRAGYREHELDGLVNHLKSCRYLPGPDREVVAVIEILLCNLLPSRFDQLISVPADCREMGMFVADLCERVRHEGERMQAIAKAIEWEHASDAKRLAVKHAVEVALTGDAPAKAYKMSFLRKTFMPATREAAYSLLERANGNDRLFQQEMSGEKVYRQPDALPRPDIASMRRDLSALKGNLDRAPWVKELIQGGVITVDFSCIHGFYLGAVLLADGHKKAALEELTGEIDRLWDEVTNDDGHVRHWSPSQCSWSGLIEPNDTAKKASLVLELECRAMREKYIRPKGSELLPTFTFIQPVTGDMQQREKHHA
ncbi:hypothetical protein [Variovorax boronicumulans]